MYNSIKKIAVIGAGGFAREISCNLNKKSFDFFVHQKFIDNFKHIKNIKAIEDINIDKYKVLVAIGDPNIRKKIILELPQNTEYYTYIDKRAHILDKKNVNIGSGSIITAGCVLTTDIIIRNFTILNLNTTIGHESYLGDFVTTTPGVHISGNTNIGSNCYFGSGSVVRNKITICPDVTIGMNGVVTKDIYEPGIYAGVPIKKIN